MVFELDFVAQKKPIEMYFLSLLHLGDTVPCDYVVNGIYLHLLMEMTKELF